MLIENNTLKRIDPEDIIDGVFIAPDEVLYVGNNLVCNDIIKIILPNVIKIGDEFLFTNNTLTHLEIPKVIEIGCGFMGYNNSLMHLEIPEVEIIGFSFLYYNKILKSLIIPNIKKIGRWFLYNNNSLVRIDMSNVKEIKEWFLFSNRKFNYTPNIIKALIGEMYINGLYVDKTDYLRKFNLKKILC